MADPDGQVVLYSQISSMYIAAFKPGKSNLWMNELLIPAYLATFSAAILVLHGILASKLVQKLVTRMNASEVSAEDEDEDIVVEPAVSPHTGIINDIKTHVRSIGGPTIFTYKVLRLLGCLVLVGLTIATLVIDEEERERRGSFRLAKKHKGKKNRKGKTGFSEAEWLQVALCLTYSYATLLALISVSVQRAWARMANMHLVLLLLITFVVFTYRDLWPLATYTLQPADAAEGALFWVKVAVLTYTGVIVPLVIPRQYVPIDPKDPASEPNPEQTAPLLSVALYNFLDPVVFKAYRVPHLPVSELPPLADYDYGKNLVRRSFKYLDTFSGAKRTHLFFGLMKVFRYEYLGIFSMTVIRVITMFASPLGIYGLLSYLDHPEEATVRPWFWIMWLFLGPVLGSIVMQWYIFLTTSTLVRTEGIITELVFEHALRIRMKAQLASDKSLSRETSVVNTPDTASIADTDDQTEVNSVIGEGSTTSDGTLFPSNSEAGNSDKGKRKSVVSSISGKSTASQKSASQPDSSNSTDNLVGKLNNLVTTDLANIGEGRDFLLLVVFAPLMVGIGIWFLYELLGWSALVGLVVMIVTFPLPGYIAKLIQSVQKERMKKTDARVQSVTEVMNVIRMIKLFGWEPRVNDEIGEKRDDELKIIKKRQLLELINNNINYMIPLVTMIATLVTYTMIMKKTLDAATVFSSMAVFDLIRDQIHITFFMVPAVMQAKVSIERVSEFLRDTELLDEFQEQLKEKDPSVERAQQIARGPTDPDTIGFCDATFSWSNDVDGSVTPSRRKFRLQMEGEITFKRGGINLIIGPTGSGKTSLLMALLGEMHFLPSGPTSWYSLPRGGGVAYAAQETWVQNETIRDNILFGSPYEESRYKEVIRQCGLERDLTLFEAGDRTEVGEKGLTLSGGQKARITLARAVYSRAEIILLDDVLAALDVHTAKHIIEKCFKGDLIRGRTVLLVTHNISMTSPIAHFVLSLTNDGRVSGQGTVAEIMLVDKEMQKEIAKSKAVIEKEEELVDAQPEETTQKKSDGKLVLAEEVAEGHVSWSALKLYLFNLGGPIIWLIFLGGMTFTELTLVMQTWFLGFWAAQYQDHDPSEVSVPFFLTGLSLIMVSGVAVYCIAYFYYVLGCIRASRIIHKRLVEAITGSTLRWLDSTPTGRIIARCTQDIRAVDGPVAQNLGWFIELSVVFVLRLAAVVYMSPIFVVPGIIIGALGGWCGQVYMKAQLSVKREMSNAKSPVLSHFGAAIAGLVSIRAYNAQNSFKLESLERVNRYTRAARTFYNLNRWVCVRIEILGGLFSSGLAAYLVYVRPLSTSSNTGFSLNMAGMLVSVGVFCGGSEYSMISKSAVRVRLSTYKKKLAQSGPWGEIGNSLERIQGYIDIEQEPKATADGIPPAHWPSSGNIRAENLCARYSSTGPKVLHDICFNIKSGERVGVVGRTGSGKSSLTLALLRCILTEGSVYYDGIATDSINLDILRRNITIIPQVPELLSGTLRRNLDPFDEHDDATLNAALRSAGLFNLQKDDEDGRITLDSQIAAGGSNLSVGQRQILALARAIVRGSKLLILDEATSAIDYETDTIIQESLRSELSGDITLITVAHRLQTIMDSDKIMVLDAGKLVEFDSPQNLLKKEGSMLKALVDESGDREKLYAMAAGSQ